MDQDGIQEKVILAVRTVAGSSEATIPLDTPMELLVADSLAQLSLIHELETALGIDISSPELVEGVKTLGDLVEKMRGIRALQESRSQIVSEEGQA